MCKPVQVTAGAMLLGMIGPKATLGLMAVAVGGVALYAAVVTVGATVAFVAAVSTIALIALPICLARRAHRPVPLGYQHALVSAPAKTTIRLEAHTVPALAEVTATLDPISALSDVRLSV